MRGIVAASGAVFLLAAPPFANAEDTPDWKSCISATNTGAERFASCTEVIDSKAETGRRLAAAYCIRGHERPRSASSMPPLADLTRRSGSIRPMPARTTIAAGLTRFKGDYDRAIADYDEAIKIDSNMCIAYNNRGDA